jgi:hypothetical protein
VKPLAWAIIDADDNVLGVELSRVVALDTAARTDGARVAPLVLDDVEPDVEPDDEPDDEGKASPLHLLACAYAVLAALIVGAVAPAGTALAGLVAGAAVGVLGLAGVAAVRRAVTR